MGLSRLSDKCCKCKYVDICDHKRMEALAYYEEAYINAGQLAPSIIIQPHVTVTIDLEEMKRKINESLYGNI
jgi:hypothetical protein